jgi:hypothetical protein
VDPGPRLITWYIVAIMIRLAVFATGMAMARIITDAIGVSHAEPICVMVGAGLVGLLHFTDFTEYGARFVESE